MTTYSPSPSVLSLSSIPRGRIGRFIVEREIGRGSVGTVYLFRDPLIGRKVAIKILNPQLPSDQRRLFEKHFIQEARAAGRLNHPNIVTVYDADKSDDLLFIAMEYLDGKELREILSSGHQFTYKQIADLVARIANALDYAHQNGVIHRDIKPANIFIVGKSTPKVLDFGIASASRQLTDPEASLGFGMLAERRLLGSPSYMSPEQTRAEILDARTDIFSLGVVLYELLCGELPFKADSIQALLESIEYDLPVPPHHIRPDVPSRLAYIAGKALAKNPADRYATAAEMALDLNRFIAKERTNQIIATLRNPVGDGSVSNASDGVGVQEGTPYRLPILIGMGALIAIVAVSIIAWASHRVAPKKSLPAPVLQTESRNESVGQVVNPVAALPKTDEPTTERASVNVAPTVAAEPKEKPAAKIAAKAAHKAKSKPAIAKPVAPAVGSILIAVTPWGEVFVDGKSKGVAPPLTHLSLPNGAHSIEIRNGEEHYAVKVNITSDNETKIGHRF